MTGRSREARDFIAAAGAFVAVVEEIPEHVWDRPGVGVWSVRELVGHTSRSLTTVTDYLQVRAERVDVEDPAGYFMTVLQTTTHEAVAERGRQAAGVLGTNPLSAIRRQSQAATDALSRCDDDVLVQTPAGGMRLLDYLPTRTFELTVHSMDLVRAAGSQRELPPEAVAAATRLAVELALRQGKGPDVLLALNHRQPLRADFAIL